MKLFSAIAAASLAATALGATVPAVDAADAARLQAKVSALDLLAQLATGVETNTGFTTSEYTVRQDRDGDGCDTRAEVLIAESRVRAEVDAGCRVRRGKWLSRYDGQTFTRPRHLAIDHVVPLGEAWGSGAKLWTRGTRDRFANDLGYRSSLIAVSSTSSSAKGDQDPTEWLPPRKKFRCSYAKQYTAVKYRWDLAVDAAERSKLERLIGRCDDPTIRQPQKAEVVLAGPVLIGDWAMNESSGRTMNDASSNNLDGNIGDDVKINWPTTSGGRGYHFDGPLNVKNHERLVLVPDDARLDPGTGTYSVAVRFRTNGTRPNILQKGQSEDSGGYWKLVIHTGWPRCHYRDENYNTKAIGFYKSPNPDAKVSDGNWHTLRCVRNLDSVCVYLDEGTSSAMKRCIKGRIGRIDNKWPLSIGGKYRCDASRASTTCDYFNGDIDWVRIERP